MRVGTSKLMIRCFTIIRIVINRKGPPNQVQPRLSQLSQNRTKKTQSGVKKINKEQLYEQDQEFRLKENTRVEKNKPTQGIDNLSSKLKSLLL